MPTIEQIKSLVDQMPNLDNPPPPPPRDPKNPKPPGPQFLGKGKLTGPTWEDAAKTCDAILAGGKEAIAMVIDLITENDIGNAYKPRYVLHVLAIYTTREGKEKDRAALISAILPALQSDKPKTTRAFLISTLQACADAAVIPSLAPLLTDSDLADPAAQAIVALALQEARPNPAPAIELLRAALPSATARPRMAIIQALGALNDASATNDLARDAAEGDENSRVTALWTLSKTNSPQAIDPILKAAQSQEGWLRRQATQAALDLAESLAASNQKDNARKICQSLIDSNTQDRYAHIKQTAQRALNTLHLNR